MPLLPLETLARRAVLAAALALAAAPAAAFNPERPECIAPANPGGGWDTICRTSANVLQKTGALKSTMYVTNMPGGSGAVARPRGLTCSATPRQWLTGGDAASATFPTICDHMCSVAYFFRHSSSGRSGQRSRVRSDMVPFSHV